ncbi:MAG: hypothetical protein AAB439_02450 [Patescibacteria group bacterium]
MNEQKQRPEPTLEEVYKLAKENNKILHAMRRDAFVGGVLKFVFWIVLFVLLPYIAYVVYLQPYITTLQGAYDNLNEKADTLSGAAKDLEEIKSKIPDVGSLLNQFGGGN